MAEELVLTDPVTTPPVTTTKYRVVAMFFDMEAIVQDQPIGAPPNTEPGSIVIRVKDNNNVPSVFTYKGKEAQDWIKWINTANLTNRSLQKRVLEKLSADGYLPGTVTGTPDPVIP